MTTRFTVLVTAPFDAEVAVELNQHFDVTLCDPLDISESLAGSIHSGNLAATDVLVAELDLVDVATLEMMGIREMVC